MKKINITITFVVTLLFSACATYSPQYSNQTSNPSISTVQGKNGTTFYLFGNGIKEANNSQSKVRKAFNSYLTEHATEDDVVLYLGNNFEPNNLSEALLPKGDARLYVVPGTSEWNDGVDGLEDVEDFLKDRYEDIYEDDDVLEPNNGCPLKSLDFTEDIQLLLIDTQWYLENWDDNLEMNDKCEEITTRHQFFVEIEGELKKNKEKTIIFAMQHPLYTNGYYGGKFPASRQLFPPFPGAATLYTQIQSQGAISPKDRYNERYNELMDRIEVLSKDHEHLVFVSGHEQSLQYIESPIAKQVISGAVGKTTAAALGRYGQFSYGKEGFSKVFVGDDKSVTVTFFGVNDAGEAEILFEKQIIEPVEAYDVSHLPDTFPQTMEASVYPDSLVDRTGFFKTVWGQHYRKVYGTKVTAPVVDLDTLYGGLEVKRAGGGHQTVSLRLKGRGGRDYNMRALRKSAVQFLQTVIVKDKVIESDFRNTLPEDLILDFYTAAHPYGAFTIPDLADAADVFHTNPKLFYVPKQKALGKFNETYGDELYMIVERPDEEYDGPTFAYAEDIISTDDMLYDVRADEENKVDQKAYIRARIFDMLIGDWDRHNDQWRWALQEDENGDKIYKPIPRDRDQVYANFDGGLLDAVRTLFSTARQFQVYGEELEHTKWFNTAGIKLDKAFIENYGREEWIAQAEFIKNNVTNEVIDEAFSKLPKEVQDETAADIKEKLRGRRDNIVKIAEEYYDYFSKQQTITGTDKDDHFTVTRLPNEETRIQGWRIKDGEKGEVLIDRVYTSEDTDEIWLYGLDDDDIFEVEGEGDNLIFIRIIGGLNNDIYRIKNGRKIKVYDQKSKDNTIEERGGAAFRITDNHSFNRYDYLKQNLTTNLLLPAVGFNPDDGFLIGVTDVLTINGFQENPFKQQHRFNFGYYFATQSFNVNYQGEFANIFGDWNFLIGGNFRNPNFAENFFGFGNETINVDDEDGFDRDFNRVRIGGYGGSFGIKKDGNYGSTFKFMLGYQAYEVEDTEGRFISQNPPIELDETKSFATATGTYMYNSFDSNANPTRGMEFNLEANATQNITDEEPFAYVKPQFTLYNAISQNRKLVLRTTALGQFNFGDGYEFYQAAQLGRDYGLRGYRRDRFTGESAVAGQADLRYSFPSFRTALTPIQIGVLGGYDVGRVWVPNDMSDEWHSSYGGGIWINAANLASGTVNVFTSDEGIQFSFRVAVSL
ncbi:phosphoesterase [Flavobacteriaceae bacterium TK19130]|nr:phosphoesterase [Thermobacterium salinum]